MKKALSILLALATVFSVVAIGISGTPHISAEEAVTEEFTENGFVYKINNDYGYAIITDYTDKEFTGEIVIPETLGGYSVTRLDAESFKGCQCTSVSIPASITYVDPEAFAYDMPNMERFTVDKNNSYFAEYKEMGILYRKGYYHGSCVNIIAFPKNAPYTSVEFDKYTDAIGAFAFAEARNLKKLIWTAGPSIGTYYEIETYAFYNAKNLETVEIGNGLTSIKDYAFEGCSSLTSVSLPDKLIGEGKIGWDPFKDTPFINNPENYDEDGVLYISNHLIATLPEADKEYYAIKPNTNSVAGGAFRWNSLKEVYMPASVEYIRSNPFARCPNIEKFTLDPESDFRVNEYGILYNYNFNIVSYPNGIYRTCYVVEQKQLEIMDYAFYQSPIKVFYLPAKLDYAGIYYLSLGGDTVTDIYFEGTEEDWIDDLLYEKKKYEKETTAEDVAEFHFETYSQDEHKVTIGSDMQATCSCGYTAEYTSAKGGYAENGFVYEVVDGNAIIKSYIYKDSTAALVIPENLGGYPVTEIDCEFKDYKFTSVHIPSTVTKIREGAFAYALNNEEFTVSADNTVFGTDNGALIDVAGYSLFAYPPASSATEYVVPNSVAGIMPYAFCGAKNLKTVTMPRNDSGLYYMYTVGIIFDGAFMNSSVETVNIEGNDFFWMGNEVFKNSQLKEINFSLSKEHLGDNEAFPYTFGYDVFEGTPFLENAVYDGNGVFYYNDILIATKKEAGKSDYRIKDGTTAVVGNAFKWSNLESVNIPASVKCIGNGAFSGATNLKTVTVDSNNKFFSVDDHGVLYNKKNTRLVAFPAGIENICYAVPEGVTEICDLAFGNVQVLECVYIPLDVTTIGEYAFGMGEFEHVSEIRYEGTKSDWNELRAYNCNLEWARYESLFNIVSDTYIGGEHTTSCVVTENTCEETGTKDYSCTCGYQYTKIIPAAGHKTEGYKVIREATCTREGYSVLYCTVCGDDLNTRYTAELGHDKVLVEYIYPTCEETGKNHYRCTRCELDFYEDIEDALGHVSSEETVKIDPTCTEDGGLYYVCERCGEPNLNDCAETYPATGHTEGEWKRIQEPTCRRRQIDTLYCAVCNGVIETKTGELGTHKYTETVITQTCTYKKVHVYCSGGCGDSYYDEVVSTMDAILGENEFGIGHIVEDVFTEPTCTETGKSYKLCTVCGATVGEVTETEEALGHSGPETVIRDATCSEEGLKSLTCTVCGEVVEEAIPQIAHTFGEWKYESGNTFTGVCSVCGENFDSLEVEISFNESSVILYEEASKKLSVTVTENISDNIVFSSSDSNIVTVYSNGKISAKAPGKAVITARIEGTEIIATCEVTVNPKYFSVKWIVNGSIIDCDYIEKGTKIEVPDDPEIPGYVFAGWTPEVPETMPETELTFTAVFEPITYTATFMHGDEVIGTDEFIVSDETLDYPEIEVKEHYDWVWDDDGIIAGNIVVNGRYVPTVYTATFVADGVMVEEIKFNVENQTIVAPETPQKEGYTVAWEEHEFILADFTVNAVYTPIVYTASFYCENKLVLKKAFTVETTIKQLAPPKVSSRAGYSVEWDEYSIVARDIEVNARYVPIVYTAQFIADGTVISTQEFTVETENLAEPDIPQKAGYIAYWSYYKIEAKNLTIVAKYDLPKVTMISKKTTDVGETYRLLPSCNFEATEKSWTSSDTSVATVNQNGMVTAVGKGECKITVTCSGKDSLGNDINASKSTTIVVKDNSEKDTPKRSFRDLFDEFFEVKLHDLVYNLKEFMIVLLRYAY